MILAKLFVNDTSQLFTHDISTSENKPNNASKAGSETMSDNF